MISLEELAAEVADLRLQLQQLKQTKKQPCQGVTGKGTPCRNGALPGTPHCRMHDVNRPSRSSVEKPPKVRREPKPKKIIPEHSHPIGEFDPSCALCDSHGDCMDPSLPDHNFECDRDITDRLRELLSHEEV